MIKSFKNFAFLILLLGGFLFVPSGCTETNNEDDALVVDDKTFYEQIAYTLVKCYTDIYNQNLAGKATGNQNISTTAPLGGNVVISGNTSYDSTHSITTTDLTFTLTNVIGSATVSSESGNTTCVTQITITGATTYKGSFSSSYTSVSHLSQNLHIVGSVTYAGVVRNIDMTGQVNINRTSKVTANIFGHNVSW
jgi:hypothetical protein